MLSSLFFYFFDTRNRDIFKKVDQKRYGAVAVDLVSVNNAGVSFK
jgi:hypothetical protein